MDTGAKKKIEQTSTLLELKKKQYLYENFKETGRWP